MKLFNLIPKDFNLSQKLITFMAAIFVGGLVISSITYYNVVVGNATNELNTKSSLIISTMDSIRKYSNDRIRPLLSSKSDVNFILESVPDFSVRTIFDQLTSIYKEEYGSYRYKNAMINPTNSKDKATFEELKIIQKLDEYDEAHQGKVDVDQNLDKGFLKIGDIQNFYTARPIKITQTSCLDCHASLEKSPISLQKLYKEGKYGANQGFGWELNKVIGVKIIYIPADKVYKKANQNFITMLGIFIVIFASAIFLVNLWLKNYVVQPLDRMTKVAEAVSMGDMTADFEKQSNDEVGRLATAFTRLKTSLLIAMKRLMDKTERRSGETNQLKDPEP